MRSTPAKGSSITRVLEIIEAVAAAKEPLSPTALAERLDIPRPARTGWCDAGEGRLPAIRPARRAAGRATACRGAEHPAAAGWALRQAILRQLSEAIGETCGLAIPDGLDMLFDRVQTNWPLQINLPIGSHTPLWCTASGKLYLASLPPEQLERVLPHLPLQRMARNTLTDLSALRDDLARVRGNSWVPTARIHRRHGRLCGAGTCLRRRTAGLPVQPRAVIRCSMAQLLAFVPRMRAAARTGGGARQRGGAGGRSEHVEQNGDEVQQAADHHECARCRASAGSGRRKRKDDAHRVADAAGQQPAETGATGRRTAA